MTRTEKADGTWSRKGREFSTSSTAEVLRPWTIQPLDIGLSQCALVHEGTIDCRDSIKRETLFLSRAHRILILVRYLAREGKALRQTQQLRPPGSRSASVQRYTTAMEGVMRRIVWSIAVLVLALVSLAGCEYEPRAVGDANPARVAEMKQALRDLWVG